jgi:hypothetical protein
MIAKDAKPCVKCGATDRIPNGRGTRCRPCWIAYTRTPKAKAVNAARNRAEYHTPTGKAAKRAYQQTPKAAAAIAAYEQTPERKEAKRAYEQTPERKEANRIRKQTPNAKAAARARAGLPVPTRPCPELCELGCGRKANTCEHCHETGIFRGWTCRFCNLGIAALSDNLDVAIERLTRYRAVFVAEIWLAIPGSGLPLKELRSARNDT